MRRSNIWKIAATVIRKNKGRAALTFAAILGAVLAALLPPLILGEIVDRLSEGEAVALALSFTYLLAAVAVGVLRSGQNVMIAVIGQKITHEARSVMSQKFSRLPAQYFTMNESGRIVSRIVNDVDAFDALFTSGIISMFADSFALISVLIMVFYKSRGLGLILLVATPALFWMTAVFQRRMRRAQIRNREATSRVNQHLPETIRNIRMIRGFRCERFMEQKYDRFIKSSYRAIDESNFYDSIYSPIVVLTSAAVVATLMICSSLGGAVQELFGVTVGGAVAIIAYVAKVFEPLESLGMEIQNIQSALAGVRRVDEFLNEEELPVRAGEETERVHETDAKNPLVSIKDLRFGYQEGPPLFDGFNLDVERGENVVITGRTGVGKSTLLKLLLGLYEPDKGAVTIGGRRTVAIPEEERRKIFGYVKQQFAVVDGTVGEQVTLFDPRISVDQVWDVLEKCDLIEKVKRLPLGLDTPMSLADFSQGELQLLGVARALVYQPEIMLLDEMAANLDSATEEKIVDVVRTATVGRTVLTISHRYVGRLGGFRQVHLESNGTPPSEG
ncbi:MAG: ABC transporter ATP-binding protein [Thermoguttaceae bacterium]|jgi:ATP-binding cassette subfamily B multidrug efflux pump